MNKQNFGIPFSVTSSGTTQATASFSNSNLAYITDISATSTTAGTWALLIGTTPVWQGIGNVHYAFSEPIKATNSFSLKVNGATSTFANISGFYVN